jgi:AraC-like DNA-binding protein
MIKRINKICDQLSITTLTINEIVLTELNYSDVKRIPPSRAKNPILELIINGNFISSGDKLQYRCSNGCLFYIREHEVLETQFNHPFAKTFAVEINPNWLAKFQVAVPPLSTQVLPENSFANNISHLLWQEYLINDEFTPLAAQGIILQLIAVLLRERKNAEVKSPKWVGKFKEIIREQHSAKFSLEALSKELSVHPVYLSREFPKFFQCSLSEYMRRARIKEATVLLTDKTLSLTEIAHQCSFSDQSHFTRIFKKMHNLTPSQYRRLLFDRSD